MIDTRSKSTRRGMALVALAIVFIGIPAIDLVAYPPYTYALSIPRTWQGGIEVLLVAALLAGAQFIRRPALCVGAMVVVSEAYLRRHGVDFAAAIDLLYVEILTGLGCVIARRLDKRLMRNSETYLKYFLLGVCAWSVCAWALSAMGIGSLKNLRLLTLAIGVLVTVGKPNTISGFVIRRTLQKPRTARVCIALLYTWLLVLFAKTSVAIGFDSLWYGLRGQYVLVSEGSAFASAGLVSAVHYFPKLYELLLIPVSGLGNSSVIAGVTIFMAGFLALACNAILDRLGVVSTSIRVLIALCCVTLPAVSNSAIEPKPDLFSALLVVIAWLFTFVFFATRKTSALLWVVSASILATQAKLVAIPYVLALGIGCACIVMLSRQQRTNSFSAREPARMGCVALVLSVTTALFTGARTFLLAGLPTIGPDSLFHIWEKLGYALKFPAGTLRWTGTPNWSDMPFLGVDLLFAPQYLPHIITFWTGNIWLWATCAIPAFIFVSVSSNNFRRPFVWMGLALAFCGVALMFGMSFATRGGDGNYFISAIVPATLIGLAAAWQRLGRALPKIYVGCLIAFALFQGCVGFVSADWMTGTREFDTNFAIGLHTFRHQNRAMLREHGLARIDEFLRHVHPAPRVVGCLDDDLDMRLSARTESVQQIAFSRPDFLAKPAAFLHFLKDDEIKYVIEPRRDNTSAYCYDADSVRDGLDTLAADNSIPTLEDNGFVMYDLTHWHGPK